MVIKVVDGWKKMEAVGRRDMLFSAVLKKMLSASDVTL